MDPLGTFCNVCAIISLIRKGVDCAQTNKAQCCRLQERVDLIGSALAQYLPMPSPSQGLTPEQTQMVSFFFFFFFLIFFFF